MRLRGFYIGRGQRVAALLMLVMLFQCLYLVAHTPLTTQDYRYARCGREMWERPSPILGYFTTCGNLNGDGTLAYRLAGLPLSVERWVLLAQDHFRAPADRLYPGGLASTWESRHEIAGVLWLLRLPFVLWALWLGGGLWWVCRRLFGGEGGALALALYVFCPAVLRYSVEPNNEILALWGLYGLLFTMIGVAHALQGPRRKWRPRLILLTVALGLTATAHLLAAIVGFLLGAVWLFYLADRRRSYVSQILIFTALGALVIVFASFSFRPSAFLYVFVGGSVRSWFSLHGLRVFLLETTPVALFGKAVMPVELPIALLGLAALAGYIVSRRARYFGNTVPLVMTLVLVPLYTTQVFSAPWLWALPFLFTFIGGVMADAFDLPRWRRPALAACAGAVVVQAILCWSWMVVRAGG